MLPFIFAAFASSLLLSPFCLIVGYISERAFPTISADPGLVEAIDEAFRRETTELQYKLSATDPGGAYNNPPSLLSQWLIQATWQ